MAHIPFPRFLAAGAAIAAMLTGAQTAFAQIVMAPASTVQANPAGSGPINAALGWVEGWKSLV